jgi:glycosyltransferase involved in cell wall biosynthesis
MAGHVSSNKCVSLAIQALALAKKNGVKFLYHIGADGPEIPHLKRLAAKLGLSDDIHFGDNMSFENYQKELGETHVYLLPSMRETVGLTMLEAMLAGAVPVVADNCGPHLSVTEECGYKIPASTISRMAQQISDVLVTIDRNRNIIIEKGRLASQRVANLYTEEYYTKTVNAVYEAVVGRGQRGG